MPFVPPSVGKLSIYNGGGFVCRGKAKFEDDDGNDVITDNETGDIILSTSTEYDPGDLGVPDGSDMEIYVHIIAGADTTGRQHLIYTKGDPHVAEYVITGTTLSPVLGLIGIS